MFWFKFSLYCRFVQKMSSKTTVVLKNIMNIDQWERRNSVIKKNTGVN